jgi:hypothetical protein
MSLLRKSLDAVTIADLEALIEAGARETGELEFKGALPFQPQRNQPEKADRWIEKRDRVGDYARDEILAEIVAFANADGGTLVLGLHETKTEPRIAERLEPCQIAMDLRSVFWMQRKTSSSRGWHLLMSALFPPISGAQDMF